jgi:hypothetical protein
MFMQQIEQLASVFLKISGECVDLCGVCVVNWDVLTEITFAKIFIELGKCLHNQ